jgi:hypothetical protein
MGTRLNPGTEPTPPGCAPTWVEYFRDIQAYLHELAFTSAATYSIAGTAIRLQFGSECFAEQVSHAFSHLEIAPDSGASLTVLLHDLASAPYAAEFLQEFSPPGEESDMWLMDSPDLMLILQRPRRVFAAVDWNTNTAYWLIPDAGAMPYLERARPLKLLLTYWFGIQGRYLIHAAAVGNRHGGALVVGHSTASMTRGCWPLKTSTDFRRSRRRLRRAIVQRGKKSRFSSIAFPPFDLLPVFRYERFFSRGLAIRGRAGCAA